jgi:hypothetical protein
MPRVPCGHRTRVPHQISTPTRRALGRATPSVCMDRALVIACASLRGAEHGTWRLWCCTLVYPRYRSRERDGERDQDAAHAATRAKTEAERRRRTRTRTGTGTAHTHMHCTQTSRPPASPTATPPRTFVSLCRDVLVRAKALPLHRLQKPSAFPSLSKLHAQQCLCPLA